MAYRTREDLERLAKQARDIIHGYGYEVQEDIPVMLNSNFINVWGVCVYKPTEYRKGSKKVNRPQNITDRIELKRDFFECPTISEHDILEVLIHEYLHSVFPYDGHTGEWKKMANKITSDGVYKITRTSAYTNFDPTAVGYKFTVYCPECGAKWDYETSTDFTRHPWLYNHISKITSQECNGTLETIPYTPKLQLEENDTPIGLSNEKHNQDGGEQISFNFND